MIYVNGQYIYKPTGEIVQVVIGYGDDTYAISPLDEQDIVNPRVFADDLLPINTITCNLYLKNEP